MMAFIDVESLSQARPKLVMNVLVSQYRSADPQSLTEKKDPLQTPLALLVQGRRQWVKVSSILGMGHSPPKAMLTR